MSNPTEEQEDEIEVLRSIYEEKLQELSSSPPYDFLISLGGHAPEAGISCSLYFKYCRNYPNEAPIFEVRGSTGLTENQTVELVMLISDVIQRSLGAMMIFDIACEVQMKLDEFSDSVLSRAEEMEKQTARLLTLQEEKSEFRGTRVTVQSFLTWNKAFMGEMGQEGKKSAQSTVAKRLTGREMFLRDDKFDESDLTFLEAEGGEIVEVDERLFVDIGDLDDLDLDDFEGDCRLPDHQLLDT